MVLTTRDVVTIKVKARKVVVKGPRGQITKSFKHMPVEMKQVELKTKKKQGAHLSIAQWFGGYKQSCAVNTFASLIDNMVIGVTKVRSLSLLN